MPLEMDGIKPSILMGKLKQLLRHGVSADNDLFLSMFLIRLLPSMREAVGAGNHKTTIFAKISLVKGYRQIPVATEDIQKTAIIMPFGLFEYLVTPLGWFNAVQTFEHMMDHLVSKLEAVFAHMDNS
jgi:hypothetical protein